MKEITKKEFIGIFKEEFENFLRYKNANPINLIVLLLLSHIIYIGIRCYVKDWMEERGYY